MIALCTGTPEAEIQDERIIITVPSGDDEAQASLSLNQALALHASLKSAVHQALDGFASPRRAELIAFSRKRSKAGRR